MRIISGSARGRRIETIEGESTRPTGDRVRESVFGIIQNCVAGASVLDLFAGSGAMSLEALSRGAADAVINDGNHHCFNTIRENLKKLGFDGSAQVFCQDYMLMISQLAKQKALFDLVFLDPPYNKGLAQDAASKIIENGLVKQGGRIIVEHGADELIEARDKADRRRYGKTGITIITMEQT